VSAQQHAILVTGANGFVGTALCATLRARGSSVVAACRRASEPAHTSVGELDANTDWRAALTGCDRVIHLAARVHVMADASADPMAAYRSVNVDATLALARQAAAAGVRRFVFVSSVKVNGEATTARPFGAADTPAPVDPYGQSKLEAELALRQLAAGTAMDVVIVRPPLVYGPGVKANFQNLLRLVKLGVPLPFGRIDNRRSMVSLDNLVDLLSVCAAHPEAAGRTFMVSDGNDLSTSGLVALIGQAMGRAPLQLPVPVRAMALAARLVGRGALAERLFGSLQVDIAATTSALGWTPPFSTEAGIEKTVAHFLACGKRGST
jgi:nucleoside-diphosphate-sugar epimerase